MDAVRGAPAQVGKVVPRRLFPDISIGDAPLVTHGRPEGLACREVMKLTPLQKRAERRTATRRCST